VQYDLFQFSGKHGGEDRGTTHDVLQALHALRSTDTEILILRHMEGRSFADIAVLLGTTENTLKVRHHRAIARLKKQLRYE
jgi:RNA polymerase sigma factor (sigma-70 family)